MGGFTVRVLGAPLTLLFAAASPAFAAAPVTPAHDSGDTALLIAASALVLFMTLPGLAMFYGGLVRAKNFLSVLMQCFTVAAIVSVLWFGAGYRGIALVCLAI